MTTSTPWGPAATSIKFAPGIIYYSGNRNNGFRLSPKKLKQMPPKLRELASPRAGWFEDGPSADAVVLAYPHFFASKEIKRARQSLRKKFPQVFRSALT